MTQQMIHILQEGTPAFEEFCARAIRAGIELATKSTTNQTVWVSKERAKELLGHITDTHLRNLAKSGKITDTKTGREYEYDLQSIDDYKNKKSNR
jgi:hypothetical protein